MVLGTMVLYWIEISSHHRTRGVNGLLQPDLRLRLARRMRSSLRALLLDLSAAVAVRTSVLLLLCVSCPTDARSMWQVRVPVKSPSQRMISFSSDVYTCGQD